MQPILEANRVTELCYTASWIQVKSVQQEMIASAPSPHPSPLLLFTTARKICSGGGGGVCMQEMIMQEEKMKPNDHPLQILYPQQDLSHQGTK